MTRPAFQLSLNIEFADATEQAEALAFCANGDGTYNFYTHDWAVHVIESAYTEGVIESIDEETGEITWTTPPQKIGGMFAMVLLNPPLQSQIPAKYRKPTAPHGRKWAEKVGREQQLERVRK